MFYPKVQGPATFRRTRTAFGGYRHELTAAEGDWYDEENMTDRDWPAAAARGPRYAGPDLGSADGICAGDALYWTDAEGRLIRNGQPTGLTLTPGTARQFVFMGAHLVIFPDKKYLNTADPADFGSLEAAAEAESPVVTLCRSDGSPLEPSAAGETPPADPGDGDLWVDTGAETGGLKRYDAASGLWAAAPEPLVRLSAPGVGAGLKAGDGVTVSGLHAPEGSPAQARAEALNGVHVLTGAEADSVTFPGLLPAGFTAAGTVRLERRCPDMDYVCQCGNRLWGCFHGVDAEGRTVNQLYACRLGDFTNWQTYEGLSTDAWAAACGTPGPWTGCAAYDGCPTFFKQDAVHRIYVSPNGAHQVASAAVRGVRRGCWRSLAVCGEVLYYVAREGVMAYTGAMPVRVSDALGEADLTDACAGVLGDRYYLTAGDGTGVRPTFVYHPARRLWHRHSPNGAVCWAQKDGVLYWQTAEGRLGLSGPSELVAAVPESYVPWYCETGMIGFEQPEQKVLSRFLLRLYLGPGARCELLIRYDDGDWVSRGIVEREGVHSVLAAVLPRRCDHCRLRLQGQGEMRLYSLSCVLEEGSDNSWYFM
ncbi:MAG: hypothetical protein IKH56_06175 [Oscillospiraceae bacterium]|nr:hypothetical protein [Oscillospiraceae bacterium]